MRHKIFNKFIFNPQIIRKLQFYEDFTALKKEMYVAF